MKKILNREFIACSSLSQLSLIGVVAWSGFAHPSDANGAVITVEVTNFYEGDFSGGLTVNAPAVELGGANVSATTTVLPDGSTFNEVKSEALTGVGFSPISNTPGTILIDGMGIFDAADQPVPSVPQLVAFVYYTAAGVPQPMSDAFGLGLVFAPLPSDPNIQAFVIPLVGGGVDLTHSLFLSSEFADGMGHNGSAPGSAAAGAFGEGTGSFDVLGLTAVKNDIDGVSAGVVFAPVPEPSSSVLLVSAFGFLLARRRR